MPQPSVDSFMKELRLEFIENTCDRLITVDDLISGMMEGTGETGQNMMELQRHIHSIKGQGGTFDFPLVSTIAHRLEDYIETSIELKERQFLALQKFVDEIRQIFEKQDNPSASESEKILKNLPVTASTNVFSDQLPTRTIRILLVMPKGTQRRIIGKELASCGFHIVNSETPLEAIGVALAHTPDIIVASRIMEGISGQEFAKIIDLLKTTSDCRVVIATSTDVSAVDIDTFPAGTAIVQKGANFSEDLTEHLIDWGYFGDIGSVTNQGESA